MREKQTHQGENSLKSKFFCTIVFCLCHSFMLHILCAFLVSISLLGVTPTEHLSPHFLDVPHFFISPPITSCAPVFQMPLYFRAQLPFSTTFLLVHYDFPSLCIAAPFPHLHRTPPVSSLPLCPALACSLVLPSLPHPPILLFLGFPSFPVFL